MNALDEPTTRLVERQGPQTRLRVVRGVGTPDGSRRPGWLHGEWAGRVGHPSSYGLLGGTRAQASSIRVAESGATFRDSLAGASDDVRWGLEQGYEPAIMAALGAQLQPVLITTAAHGSLGSSPHVFGCLARLLSALLATDLPSEDNDLWRMVDRAWNP
ncbi:hypothetical protein G7075_02225 [Phycicoccus sp. HDW14]|uniref:hypothetical protein n=1 Tax=Phycicoccus sp. HDW14 TaxID=2714941 RepID=UPI00140B0382|nr:hypothetical protein [Phycicoccus sp. HDW14]QIM20242.1 hypothetical protein G7075_02225 [Phycicoccus sp. HDW14]